MGYSLLVKHLGVAREVLPHRSRSQDQDGTNSTSFGDYRVTIHSVESQSLPSLHMEVAGANLKRFAFLKGTVHQK